MQSPAGPERARCPRLSSAASDVLRFAEQGTAAAGAPRFDPDKLARIPEVDRRWAWVEIDLNAIRHNALGREAAPESGVPGSWPW